MIFLNICMTLEVKASSTKKRPVQFNQGSLIKIWLQYVICSSWKKQEKSEKNSKQTTIPPHQFLHGDILAGTVASVSHSCLPSYFFVFWTWWSRNMNNTETDTRTSSLSLSCDFKCLEKSDVYLLPWFLYSFSFIIISLDAIPIFTDEEMPSFSFLIFMAIGVLCFTNWLYYLHQK